LSTVPVPTGSRWKTVEVLESRGWLPDMWRLRTSKNSQTEE
jgi:hypothetical protein